MSASLSPAGGGRGAWIRGLRALRALRNQDVGPPRSGQEAGRRCFAPCDRDAVYILCAPCPSGIAAGSSGIGHPRSWAVPPPAVDGARAWLGAWRLRGRAKEGRQASEGREARQHTSIRSRVRSGASERRPCSRASPSFAGCLGEGGSGYA